MDKKLLNENRKNIRKIINSYGAYLVQGCNNFKNFTGRDIDAFYENKKKYLNIEFNNTVIRNKDNNHLRIYINSLNNIGFLSLDIEELLSMPLSFRRIFEKNFNKIIYCKHTHLNHLDKKSIIFYKLYKYFFVTIHSIRQLQDLKRNINSLNKKDFDLIQKSINEALPKESEVIQKFLFWNFRKFIKNKTIKNYFSFKISARNEKRFIFAGKLNLKKVFFKKNFFLAFVLGKYKKWVKTHNPMPAIAIVGNDGSGKTTTVEYIRKNFSKMDPLILNMKPSDPFFSIIPKIVNFFKKISKNIIVRNFILLKAPIAILAELLIIFDKFVKYKIGMAWADSGLGVTIFERYPTDRIRGEFPNEKSRLLPFEQFFPFPDGIVYLDALPEESVRRKKKDNHSLSEMKSKRRNYISLLREFDEYEIIKPSKNIANKIKKMKNYIFDISKKKKIQIKKSGTIKRISWKKNFNRVLAGKELNRSQKSSFL